MWRTVQKSINIFIIISVVAIPTAGFSQNIHTQVEDVKINKTKFRNTWGVVGLLRNMESRPIKGWVKIKYLNAINSEKGANG